MKKSFAKTDKALSPGKAERFATFKGIAISVTRPIISYDKDAQGMFIQPDQLTPMLAVEIEHNRMRMAKKWDYADTLCGDAHTYHDEGNYNCGDCNQEQDGICELVYDDDKEGSDKIQPPLVVDKKFGSCGKFEVIDSADPELKGNRLPASVANYGVRKDGAKDHVFGCHECWKKTATKWAVENDRVYWCGEGATTVQAKACCTLNGAPVK